MGYSFMKTVDTQALEKAMLKKGVGARDLSVQIEMSDNTVYRIFRSSKASPRTILRIADALDVKVEDLVVN